MTATVTELFRTDDGTTSRDGKSDESTLVYAVSGAVDRSEAYAAVNSYAPGINGTDNLALQKIRLEKVGPLRWLARCEYGVIEPLDVGEYTISCDQTGGTAHITTPTDTARAYPTDDESIPSDLKKVVNVDRDRRVLGVDVPSPVTSWVITYRQPGTIITLDYVKVISSLTGRVNRDAFAGFDKGEVLFLGANFKQGTRTDPNIEYKFATSPNVVGMTIGDIEGIVKRGWEYLWVWYEEAKDANADALIAKPKAVYVSPVHKFGNFRKLLLTNISGGS